MYVKDSPNDGTRRSRLHLIILSRHVFYVALVWCLERLRSLGVLLLLIDDLCFVDGRSQQHHQQQRRQRQHRHRRQGEVSEYPGDAGPCEDDLVHDVDGINADDGAVTGPGRERSPRHEPQLGHLRHPEDAPRTSEPTQALISVVSSLTCNSSLPHLCGEQWAWPSVNWAWNFSLR